MHAEGLLEALSDIEHALADAWLTQLHSAWLSHLSSRKQRTRHVSHTQRDYRAAITISVSSHQQISLVNLSTVVHKPTIVAAPLLHNKL